MPFASGKTFTLEELLEFVKLLRSNPTARTDPAYQDQREWLFAHFEHNLDQDEWLRTLPSPPPTNGYRDLLFTHLDTIQAKLESLVNVTLPPRDIPISVPHHQYLEHHA